MHHKITKASTIKVAACLTLFVVSLALGDFYSYSHDFSSDPNWTTNDPSYFHWNPSLETYHLTIVSDGSAKYTYEDITWFGATNMFRFDIKITQDGYGSGIWFGVYSEGMENYLNDNIVAHMGRDDGGHNIFLHTSANNNTHSAGVNYDWQLNVWYRIVVYYDELSNNVVMVVMNRSTGAVLQTLTVDLAGTLSSLVKIGASNVNISQYGGTFQAEIDNLGFANWNEWWLRVSETAGYNAMHGHPSLILRPNPARGHILIEYELPITQKVSLELIDIQGRIIEKLIDREAKSAGIHKIDWQYKNISIPAGIYFVSYSTDDGSAIKKIVTLD